MAEMPVPPEVTLVCAKVCTWVGLEIGDHGRDGRRLRWILAFPLAGIAPEPALTCSHRGLLCFQKYKLQVRSIPCNFLYAAGVAGVAAFVVSMKAKSTSEITSSSSDSALSWSLA
jgi:hypothetical protein